MKKIILLFFILASISFSFEKYNFKFKKVDLLNIEVSKKHRGKRSLEGIVKNKSSKKIKYVQFKIKYRDKDAAKNSPYYTVGTKTFYNLEPKERINFKTSAKVLDMDGRDFKIELTKIIMEE